jgi:hypothetical protein
VSDSTSITSSGCSFHWQLIRGALRPDEAADARETIDRVYASMAKAGSLGPDGSVHLLSAVTNCAGIACLTDHPATFPYV